MAHLDVETHIPVSVIPGMGYMCLWTLAPGSHTQDPGCHTGGGGRVPGIQHARGLSNRIHTS